MPKRTHSETVTPTVTPATAAVESPKKRGRPCKKLDPLPKDVMKALGILNNYVEKQQAQAQAQAQVQAQAQAASDSDVAAISSSEVSEETPPVKRKRGWPKGKPRKPKSPSPEVSEEAKPEEAGVAQERDKSKPGETSPGETDIDHWVLCPASESSLNPSSLGQDDDVISLVREYLATSKKLRDITKVVPKFELWDFNFENTQKYIELENRIDDLDSKLQDIGVFHSEHCTRENWKMRRLSTLSAKLRKKIDQVPEESIPEEEVGVAVAEGLKNKLFEAASKGTLRDIHRLLKRGADVNASDENGCTPLHVCAKHGRVQAAAYLMEVGGANVEAKDDRGSTPISVAFDNRHLDLVRVLSRGAKELPKENKDLAFLMSYVFGYKKNRIL